MGIVKKNGSGLLLFFGISTLIFMELYKIYLLNPIGSNQENGSTVAISYFLSMQFATILKVIIGLGVLALSIKIFKKKKSYPKILIGLLLVTYGGVLYLSFFIMRAVIMFHNPKITIYKAFTESEVPLSSVVMGTHINGKSKAYPIQYLAYHHMVQDEIGNSPVLVTYCTMCRSGRVFDPVIEGEHQQFRLVGMSEYNALIEDQSSLTWWQQATGEAVAGPLKGALMTEIKSEEMTLAAWIKKYPNTLILQPDSNFTHIYTNYQGYATGGGKYNAGKMPWDKWSWVIGISYKNQAKAFDYNRLKVTHITQGSIGETPVVIALENDSSSFHTWDSRMNGMTLNFEYLKESGTLTDTQTQSIWNMSGKCISGTSKGAQLKEIQSYLEYWHSWKSFHPNTLKAAFN